MQYERAGFALISCLLVGTLIGMVFGNLEAGGTIGLGAGMLAIVLLRKN
ncbi:hypothetical protein ACFSTA_09845 [Ornithinibacillus salinisoli]|uniref:Glycine zipper family protein n=1 Tax=Ornithinibacillus salinisoli TaxID=1848459 RepID=A0ABW4W072_9BACI